MPTPVFALAKLEVGAPSRVTTSVPITALKGAVPDHAAVVVLSYTVLLGVNPVIVKVALVILALKPIGCVKVQFPAFAPPNVLADVTAIPLATFTLAKVPK